MKTSSLVLVVDAFSSILAAPVLSGKAAGILSAERELIQVIFTSLTVRLDYAGPEILRGERYYGKEQDVWAFGVVAYVLLVGECPFMTAAEAQEGLASPFANASISLDERCSDEKEREGEESDGGGALGDAAALVRACLQVQVSARPSFEQILQSRFLAGKGGWTSL